MFASNFMTSFIRGKIKRRSTPSLDAMQESEKLEFSSEAKAVFSAGREIFSYYHAQDFGLRAYNVNASLYDIKEFFQGRNARGVMNPPNKSKDSYYKTLVVELNHTLNALAKKIESKIYEHGFLKK